MNCPAVVTCARLQCTKQAKHCSADVCHSAGVTEEAEPKVDGRQCGECACSGQLITCSGVGFAYCIGGLYLQLDALWWAPV
jgi:hypothetical protein